MSEDKIYFSDSLYIDETILESGIIIKNDITILNVVKSNKKICVTFKTNLESLTKAALFNKEINLNVFGEQINITIKSTKVNIENNYNIVKVKGELKDESRS